MGDTCDEELYCWVGNELYTDDAVGIEVVKRLGFDSRTGSLETFIIGGDLLAIPVILAEYERVFIIDALPPGSEYGNLEIVEYQPGGKICNGNLSLHDMDLFCCLQYAREVGFSGRIILIGITTNSIDPGFGLSAEISGKLEEIIQAVAKGIIDYST